MPRLDAANCSQTSQSDLSYNCIAWAAGEDRRWWWPSGRGGHYWPTPGAHIPTIDVFRSAFAGLGYKDCKSGRYQRRYEKIALYASTDGWVTHAARQVRTRWTSKLGEFVDIEHDRPNDVGGGQYGEVVQFMRRRKPSELRKRLRQVSRSRTSTT